MISNTTTYKLKASKSSRDLNEYLDSKTDDSISEEDPDNHARASSKSNNDHDFTTSRSTLFGHKDGRFKTRGKYEYRSSRGGPSDRRNNAWRGRGGYIFRKYDQDSGEVGYIPSRKFQEPLSKSHEPNCKSYLTKFYDTDKAKCEYGINFLEDTRVSKLVRRLSVETDQEKSLCLCKKLLDALIVPDNARYVRRASSMVLETLFDILCYGSGPVNQRLVARALGRVGYVMETDFRRYFDWLFVHKFAGASEEIKVFLIKSLKETLALEKKNAKIQEFAADLMVQLQSILETTDVAEVFMATMEIVLMLEEIYPDIFTTHFRDTVDILLGWHVDNNQTVRVTEFASKSLVRLSKHWQNNVNFSLNLMSQFLEDMEPYAEQLHNRNPGRASPLDEGPLTTDEILERITALIRAFTTVLKGLGDHFNPHISPSVSMVFVTDCLSKVLKTTYEALESYVPDNLTIAANECIALLLGILQTKAGSVSESLYSMIDLQLSLTQEFTDPTLVSMLLMISRTIKELSANLPIELVQKLVGPNSELLKLRFASNKNVQSAVVEVYHSLLNLKNIPLLQEAYRCVLGDLEQAYKIIVPNLPAFCQNNPFPTRKCSYSEAELICLFLLQSLSLLANASSSIIGMWALRPSILELLANNLEPYNSDLSAKTPSLQYCVFYLLYSHCRCYNHFVSSSSLVTNPNTKAHVIDKLGFSGEVTASPSSGNLTIILQILTKSLVTQMDIETKLLLLNWINEIFLHSKFNLNTLCKTTQFQDTTQALIDSGYCSNSDIVLAVCSNLTVLLSSTCNSWDLGFYFSINNLCILHINSTDSNVTKSYATLLSLLPWFVTMHNTSRPHHIQKAKQLQDITCYNNQAIELAQHLHMKRSISGELLQLQFKKFTSYLLRGVDHKDNWLEDIFNCCSPLEIPESNFDVASFRSLVLHSKKMLHFWVTWEAALLCVNNKLRTPLGKPTETFTSIENAVKKLAKEVVGVSSETEENSLTPIQEQARVFLLLEFMEHLEKAIYNASDGCAEVLLSPAKPVRTFFHTNASTCREWLARIRNPVTAVALHVGHSAMAIRHSQAKLRDLANSDNTNTIEFEKTVVNLAASFLNLGEFEALDGLKVWCNKVSSRKIPWLQAAVDQSRKKYESAIKTYQEILRDNIPPALEAGESSTSSDPEDLYVKQFISDQIIKCDKNLNNWRGILAWKEEEVNYFTGKSPFWQDNDLEVAKIIQAQNERNVKYLEELSSWDTLEKEEKPKSIGNWGVKYMLNESEINIHKIALNSKDEKNTTTFLTKLEENLSNIYSNIQACARSLPSEYVQDFLLLQHVATGIQNMLESKPVGVFDVPFDLKSLKNVNTALLSKVLFWSEYFKNHDNHVDNKYALNLRIHIAKKARKEGNINFALKEIQHYFNIQKELTVSSEINGNPWALLDNVAHFLIQSSNKLDKNIWTEENAKAVKEIAKSLYAIDGKKNMAVNVCAAASSGISNLANMPISDELKQIGSRLLVTLSKWIRRESDPHLVKEVNNPLGRFLMVLPDIGVNENRGPNVIPSLDVAAGKLLQFGVKQYPTSAKIWSAFGEWCYMWGRSALENGIQLNESDKHFVQRHLPVDTAPEDLQQIYDILSQSKVAIDKEDITNSSMNMTEWIESQLERVPALRNCHPEVIINLAQVWRQAQKRIYQYYELAAEAFFQCLHLCTNEQLSQKGTECLSITAALRLLRFIVKHAMELQSVLETGLANTPTRPWTAIIPQLFSRLNHPEEYVRHRVSELLCRIAEVAPHLIIFPAVVGAVEGGHKFDLSDISMPKDYLTSTTSTDPELGDIEDDFDESETEESRDVLHSCFMSMVETLRKQAPETITQVQTFVSELRRISLLWDELWISTLVQHHAEIMKRLAQLEAEIVKTENNSSLTNDEKDQLIAEKHRIIIKPIVFILEQLNEITSKEPETPHEKMFQERYSDLINDVLEKLKKPENPHKPQESWQPLKMLQVKLQQRAHKRTSFALKMSDISPVLASMRDTEIAMPGLTTKSVTILSISHQVNVLPTKTKPKKLYFYGSDGHTYTYLFKGMEDLHLDERIMQFLTIANTMMAKSSNVNYRARHYSVIPLGLRSGLIRWVDGTTPLFSLYKRWQIREAAITNIKQNNSNAVPLRPSELFYNKLNPLLKEHGVKNIENRKEWPVSVLKQVLTELMAETPSDLLAKELWCRSVDAAAWWQVTKNYSYSVAVMSMIGYIIGLGDRHLDNVLIDLSTGEVIHIDYNVCFEKGKQLRVPEKVPFRMTPNMETALGVTGVEGIFRLACEHVLDVMQKGRETLLTLLEAFVYDPLVDWTPGAEGLTGAVLRTVAPNAITRQARRDLEREVILSMYHVRCAEMQADWISNRDEIVSKLTTVIEDINKWLIEGTEAKQTEENLLELHQQMALIKEAEYHGRSHSLYTLPTRFTLFQQTQGCIQNAKKALDDKIMEYDNHLQAHAAAMIALRGTQLAQWIQELNFPLDPESNKIFDIVKDFLQNAGQNTMITQCEQVETDVTQLAQQQLHYIRSCLDLLSQYSTIAGLYPMSYLDKHRSSCYKNWCIRILESRSVEVCREVLAEYNALFGFDPVSNPLTQQVVAFTYQLQSLLNDTNIRLKKSFERLATDGVADPDSHLDKMYNDARTSISNFLRTEKSAVVAFECVTITALCGLNKRYLTMEAAAATAGDYLVDLTLRDGDWFLDEMHLISSLVTELSNLISAQSNPPNPDDGNITIVLDCLKTANNIYKGLQELNFNFHTIILPESVKTMQTEEKTVTAMISDINGIILSIGVPLPEILNQLERHLRFIVMKMESPHGASQNAVAELRTQFEALLHSQSTSETLTPGQMLLMGFNGLFDKLQVESNNLIMSLASLETPSCWKNVDQFREAKSLSAPVFSSQTRSVLDDIFLLKRLQTMAEFFSLCGGMCRSFKGHGMATVFDDDRLGKPIRRFTADYVSRQLLGVTSQTIALALCFLLQRMGINVTNEIEQRDIGAENKVPLEELCRKAVDVNIKRGVFSANVLAQATGLCSNLETAWRKRELARYIQQAIEIQRSTLQRLQLQMTVHQWLHEDIIMMQPNLVHISPLNRSTFLLELRKACSALLTMQARLTEAREQQRALIASAEQRLKWAAGANPDLNDVLASFDCAVSIREDRLNVEQKLAVTIGNTCNTILHHEALRTRTSEAVTQDTVFVNLVNNWESACIMLLNKGYKEEVTPTEAALIKIMPIEENIDPTWIKEASTKLQNLIVECQKLNADQKETMTTTVEKIKTDVAKLKVLLNTHHKLFSDVRNLLKTMAKMEECSIDLHKFLRKYRKYLEVFTSVVHKIGKEQEIFERETREVLGDLASLKQQTVEIYDQLLNLEDGKGASMNARPPLIRQNSVWMSPHRDVEVKKGKAGREQKNAYAIAVWHKVRLKLEGRDPDPGVKYSLHEQVDHVIKEATSMENLALLYEGWTPWV